MATGRTKQFEVAISMEGGAGGGNGEGAEPVSMLALDKAAPRVFSEFGLVPSGFATGLLLAGGLAAGRLPASAAISCCNQP